jgi:hypothetical protein
MNTIIDDSPVEVDTTENASTHASDEPGLPVNTASFSPAFFTEATETKRRETTEDEDLTTAALSFEERQARRLAKKPTIDHLEPGTVTMEDGTVLPLFDVGSRIVVERYISWDLSQWLDTRVYKVVSIDDDSGLVRCLDEEANHNAIVGFKSHGQTFKMAPLRGDPFTAPKVKNAGREMGLLNGQAPQNGGQKRRGRPPGSKNRPRDVVMAEREAKRKLKGK